MSRATRDRSFFAVLFSKKCEYAIRALVFLARRPEVKGAQEISQSESVPYHFIAKILQELKAKGFVRSVRGNRGGFQLARPASSVRLMDVLKAIDGEQALVKCLYGLEECSDSDPCPLHDGWKDLRGRIEQYLTHHTLDDLAAQ